MIDVMIADDHPVFHEGIRPRLERQEDIRVVLDGYLIKDEDPETYVRAVRDVAAGKKYFSQRTFEVAIDSAGSSVPSARELEILELAAQDIKTAEIARRLLISSSTVNTHLARVYRKLGVNSRTAAVAKVVQLGYITL
jgi:DNA-binding NarL/FixJ family response regulator